MTCQEVMDYMQRQLDGDLDGRETDILHKHTRHCPDCAAMLDRLQRLSGELDSLPKVTPPYSLVDAILPQLDELDSERAPLAAAYAAPEETSRRAAPTDRRRGWLDRLPLKTLSGVVAASIVVGLFIFNYNEPVFDNQASEVATLRTQTGMEGNAGSMNGGGEPPVEQEGGVPANEEEMELFTTESADEPDSNEKSANEDAPVAEDTSDTSQPASENAGDLNSATTEQPTVAQDGKRSTETSKPSSEPGQTEAGQHQDTSKNFSNGSNADEAPAGIMSQPNAVPPAADQPEQEELLSDERMLEMIPSMTFNEDLPSASDVARGYAQADTLASPDGQMKAAAQHHLLQIYGADGMLIFESRKKPGSSIHNLSWSSDSQTLSYELHGASDAGNMENGNAADHATAVQRYLVHIKDGTETKQ